MNLRTLAIVSLATLVAACGGSERDKESAPASSGATATSGTGAPGDNAGRPEVRQPAGIRVTKSEAHGLYLADSSGRALYALREDPPNGSACYEACERAWPPLLTPTGGATVATDAGLQAQQVGTVQRNDGASQVSYAGRALYYYASDSGANQTLGHGVEDNWGHWHLVMPDGSLSTAPGGPPSEKPQSDQTPRPGG